MANGLSSKLLLTLFVLVACILLASALNFAESNDMIEDLPTCKVVVRTEVVHDGKCVRMRGGQPACQTQEFLDPLSSECTGV